MDLMSTVSKALGRTAYDVGKDALYEMCRKHPRHNREDEVISKIWLIGRSHSAAIERRRGDLKHWFIREFRG